MELNNNVNRLKLTAMKNNIKSKHPFEKESKNNPENDFPGYPITPESEDIYRQEIKESNISVDDLSRNKTKNQKTGIENKKGFEDDMSGDDLDVPGSELDDQQESIGNEDEENNYYSIGGDNHNDLEEDNG